MRRYTPGTWFGVVTDCGIAVLPATSSPALLERIFTELTAGHGLSALLDALTAEFGNGLASLPPFAIVTFVADEAHLAVRGPLTVTAEGDAEHGQLRVSGDRVTTWNENRLTTPGSITVETDTASAASGPQLPIMSGVVLCNSIVITLRPGDVPEAAPLFAPIAARPAAAEPLPERMLAVATTPPPIVVQPVPLPPAAEPAETAEPVAATVPATADPSSETLAVPEFTQGRDYDGLWGSGVMAPANAPASSIAHVVTGPIDTDHDGETLSLEQLRALGLAAPAASAGTGAGAGVVVGVPAWGGIPAPRYGRLFVTGGAEILLDRGAVIGRKPSAARFTADRMPHLVTVPSPQQDISRSHVEVRCEGENVLAVDLGTTNGTRLLRPGAEPVRLHPQEPTMLVSGDVLDLGDAITVTYREPA